MASACQVRPDVATRQPGRGSTRSHLGGGRRATGRRRSATLVMARVNRWRPSTASRKKMVGLLGELGATWSRYGQPLLRSGRSTTGRRARARAVVVRDYGPSRSWWARRAGCRWRRRAGPTSRSSRPRSGSGSRAAPPGSRRSGATSNGPCCTRSGAWGARTARAPTSACPRARSTRRWRATRRATWCWPALYAPALCCSTSTRHAVAWARPPRRTRPADTLGADVDVIWPHQRGPSLPALRARAGLGEASSTILASSPPRAGRPIVTVLDAIRTRLAFLAPVNAHPLRRSE